MKLISGVLVGAAIPGLMAAVTKRKVGKTVAELNRASSPQLDARLAASKDVKHCIFATSDGGEIHYIDTDPDGTKPVVLLCHGVSGQWWVWSAVIEGLRADNRVIAWDMRGHGQSHAGSNGVTIAAAARDMHELLTTLGLREVVLVGHSMGGMELGRFMVDYTETATDRLHGAVFLATSARSRTGTVRSGGWARSAGAINKLSKLGGEREVKFAPNNAFALSLMRSAFGPGVTRKMVDDQLRLQNEFSAKSNLQAGESIAAHDVQEQLRRKAANLASIATAVVSGTHDKLTPPLHGRGIVEALPHATWTELSNAGHNIMVEDPDAVVAVVQRLNALKVRVGLPISV
jgi:pimeloyl-ACP methyl ester carboxylesterase